MSVLYKTQHTRRHSKDERAYGQRNEDAYLNRGKYAQPSICGDCGAVFSKGRWQWGEKKRNACKVTCPACRRARDSMPAGILTISGEFFLQHAAEILGLIRNIEAKEKANHPLQRIIDEIQSDEGMTLLLSDFHITRAIVEALKHAYKGEATEQFVEKNSVMHASWCRS